MDDIWTDFNKTSGTAYIASNENAITLCSSGLTAEDSLRRMADLIETYDDPVILASALYWENERYYMTTVISGFRFS